MFSEKPFRAECYVYSTLKGQADQTLLRLDTYIHIFHGSAFKTWPSKVMIIQCKVISHK